MLNENINELTKIKQLTFITRKRGRKLKKKPWKILLILMKYILTIKFIIDLVMIM